LCRAPKISTKKNVDTQKFEPEIPRFAQNDKKETRAR